MVAAEAERRHARTCHRLDGRPRCARVSPPCSPGRSARRPSRRSRALSTTSTRRYRVVVAQQDRRAPDRLPGRSGRRCGTTPPRRWGCRSRRRRRPRGRARAAAHERPHAREARKLERVRRPVARRQIGRDYRAALTITSSRVPVLETEHGSRSSARELRRALRHARPRASARRRPDRARTSPQDRGRRTVLPQPVDALEPSKTRLASSMRTNVALESRESVPFVSPIGTEVATVTQIDDEREEAAAAAASMTPNLASSRRRAGSRRSPPRGARLQRRRRQPVARSVNPRLRPASQR